MKGFLQIHKHWLPIYGRTLNQGSEGPLTSLCRLNLPLSNLGLGAPILPLLTSLWRLCLPPGVSGVIGSRLGLLPCPLVLYPASENRLGLTLPKAGLC